MRNNTNQQRNNNNNINNNHNNNNTTIISMQTGSRPPTAIDHHNSEAATAHAISERTHLSTTIELTNNRELQARVVSAPLPLRPTLLMRPPVLLLLHRFLLLVTLLPTVTPSTTRRRMSVRGASASSLTRRSSAPAFVVRPMPRASCFTKRLPAPMQPSVRRLRRVPSTLSPPTRFDSNKRPLMMPYSAPLGRSALRLNLGKRSLRLSAPLHVLRRNHAMLSPRPLARLNAWRQSHVTRLLRMIAQRRRRYATHSLHRRQPALYTPLPPPPPRTLTLLPLPPPRTLLPASPVPR